MQASHIYLESSKIHKTNSNLASMSSATSRLGDSFVLLNRRKSQESPRTNSPGRLFRESPKRDGLNTFVQGTYQLRPVSNHEYSNAYRVSPQRHGPKRLSPYRESPQRSKERLDRFKHWDDKLGVELRLQNDSIRKLGESATAFNMFPSGTNGLGERLSRLIEPERFHGEVPASSLTALKSSRLNLPKTEIVQYSKQPNYSQVSYNESLRTASSQIVSMSPGRKTATSQIFSPTRSPGRY